jgi:hypothetical protein
MSASPHVPGFVTAGEALTSAVSAGPAPIRQAIASAKAAVEALTAAESLPPGAQQTERLNNATFHATNVNHLLAAERIRAERSR